MLMYERCRCGKNCDDYDGTCEGKVLMHEPTDERHECEKHAWPPMIERATYDLKLMMDRR